MSTYEHLLVERHGAVGWLINNRPEQLNAMNAKMRDEFADAWTELDNDPQVRVIVLSNFSSAQHRQASLALGADLFLDKSQEFGRVPEILRAWQADAGGAAA